MKTKAALALKAGEDLIVEELDLEGPGDNEVLVEIRATGVCHTDAFTLSGDDPEGIFPAVLGHEGAGVVMEVGKNVTSVKPGDHVIPLYTPECRDCNFCLNPKTNLCQSIRETQGQGLMPDGTSRFSLNGDPIFHYMGCSTFSNYSVMPEIAVAKVREDAPFDKICYIGCGVTTGIGAVVYDAKVEPGSNVVVFGLGGIGLNVVQGAKMVGADKIIGVDINEDKSLSSSASMNDDFLSEWCSWWIVFLNSSSINRGRSILALGFCGSDWYWYCGTMEFRLCCLVRRRYCCRCRCCCRVW